VVSLDEKGRKITLKHEEIKGLMPAMTMEFPVKSPELLNGVRQGDKVWFTLRPQGADFFVEKIAKEER
jgi:Cu/Ag efflux protein CusF